MIVYLLAIASPTHPVPKELYYNGWAGQSYVNGSTYYGYKQWVGEPLGGPLFFTHYSFLGFDPRDKSDKFCNYFENNRNITLINRAYCIQNPKKFPGYGELVWGLTASDNPSGYGAHSPLNDNGTITPTAAISAMPYTPNESIATMKNFYHTYGNKLWGEFGFRDAFNLSQNWFASSYLAIDQGTIAPMIENYRTGLCWDMFMKNPEIPPMLDAIGWTTTKVSEGSDSSPRQFRVSQNYPNPFNGETLIRFTLPEALPVTMEIYNLLGEKVVTIYLNEKLLAGDHQVKFDGKNLSSGIYLFKIQAGQFKEMKKMLLTK
jgi:hypothetical protein